MLNRNFVLLLFLSALFSQSTMSGYGYGMFSQNDEGRDVVPNRSLVVAWRLKKSTLAVSCDDAANNLLA